MKLRKAGNLIAILFALIILFPSPVFAGSDVKVVREVGKFKDKQTNKEMDKAITEAQLSASDIEVYKEPDPTDKKLERTGYNVTGKYTHQDWTLLLDNKKVELSSDKKFKIKVVATGKITTVKLIEIGPAGQIKKETIRFVYDDWQPSKPQSTAMKRFSFSPGMNFSFLNYSETGVGVFSEKAITTKAAIVYFFPPSMDVGASFYFTTVPVGSSMSGTTARFLGVNARVGYVLPFVKEPWRVSLLGGVYYTTMFVSNDQFGFRNMAGPQIFPAARVKINKTDIISGYFKFSPVASGFQFSSLANREMAIGFAYVHALKNSQSFSVTLDISTLDLVLTSSVVNKTINISSTSISIGGGYGFMW